MDRASGSARLYGGIRAIHRNRTAGMIPTSTWSGWLPTIQSLKTCLIQVQLPFAPIAPHGTPNRRSTTVGATVSGFLIGRPLFVSMSPPIRYGAQYHPFSDSHREILDPSAGKFIAEVASRNALFLTAIADITLLAMQKTVFRKTSTAVNVCNGQSFGIGESSLPWRIPPIQGDQFLLQFHISVSVGDADGANAAVKPAW